MPNGIRAHVTDGVLRLRGAVERFCQRKAAEEAVRNPGVNQIDNQLEVF